jgi:hypothetical protein
MRHWEYAISSGNWGTENSNQSRRGVGIVARLYQHRTNGTYYIKRNVGAGIAVWQIHPDGVGFLKQQGVVIGADIPSYAMHVLNDRSWLFTREEAAQWPELEWAPAWESLGRPPVGHYPLWLSRQARDCAALQAASRRQTEGEQLAHHKEEAALLQRPTGSSDLRHRGNLAYFPITTRSSASLSRISSEGNGEATVALSQMQDPYLPGPATSGMPVWLAVAIITFVAIVLLVLAM